jgi:hypothetical protein
MPFTLKFSDISKTETVTVPDMPPGINSVDTSLSFVGKNYPNYGEKLAQNFLSLLENFSSPLPPENPIEGQLWYDTSDPNNKVLRIMDGTADSTRWPSANGIYQQGTDPRNTATAGLKVGDIWVDTQNALLKFYHSGNWVTVGPSVSAGLNKTGVEPATLQSSTGTNFNVILNYVNGNVVSIVANDIFTPKVVIDGFSSLKPGINLSSINSAFLNGIADSASNININGSKYAARRLLIKDDVSPQIITGSVFYQTPANQLASQGRDGIVIDSGVPSNNTYVQFYKLANDAVILNNTPGGKIIFKTKQSAISGLVSGLVIENNSVSINTSTNMAYSLDVNGQVRISGNLLLTSTLTSSLSIFGSAIIDKNLTIQQSLIVNNQVTVTNLLTVGSGVVSGVAISPFIHNSLDIGSSSKYFRNLYVSSIGSTGTGTTIYGRVIGPSNGLEKSSEFKLQGQVTATSFVFAGTGTQATFNTMLTPAAITQQNILNTATDTLTLLVIDTSTSATFGGLRQISRDNFIKNLIPTGIIIPYGGGGAPSGWLSCDGSLVAIGDYPDLFGVIGNSFGPAAGVNFYLPNMLASTTSTVGFVNYIIKI